MAQDIETIIKADFAIRDFNLVKDSIFYTEKRNMFLYDKKTKISTNYFMGGYALKTYAQSNSKTIITASNELVDTVSSVRFYNKKTNKFDAVFFYKKGKILDFLVIPEAKLFVLSLTDQKIIFIDYNNLEFYKTIEINLNTLSRKLRYINNTLFYITDKGEVFKYNFHDYSKTLLHKGNNPMTDFIVDNNILVYTTINGDLFKIDLKSNKKEKLTIDNNFISTLIQFKSNKLICGSWNGKIYILNIEKFLIEKELEYHKRTVLQIKKEGNNTLYSSSLDKTIKKWILKDDN